MRGIRCRANACRIPAARSSFTPHENCSALNRTPLPPKLPPIVHSNRMCAAMDSTSIATPVRLATGEIRIHACIHHPLQSFMVHA